MKAMVNVNGTRIRIDSILSYTPYYYSDGLSSLSIYFSTGGSSKFVEYDSGSKDEIENLVAELDKIFGI